MLPILGLGYPALWVCHVIAIMVWFFVDKKWCLLSLLTLLVGFGSCNRIFTVSLPDSREMSKLTIASFNTNFSKPIAFANEADQARMEKDFESYLKSHGDIDVLCVQENGWRSEGHIINAMAFPYKHHVEGMTVAIYSKFPFAETGVVDFASTIANTCIWADLDINGNILRVYTTHLESNRHDGQVPKVIEQEAPEAMDNSALFGLVLHYQKFSAQRVGQAEKIIAHKRDCPHQVIICGDINDTPQSNVYKILKDDLQDSFLEEGQGLGSTFGEKIPALRIDQIFVDEDLEVLDHEISRNIFSDHYLIKSVVGY